jgi:hypothetical protein
MCGTAKGQIVPVYVRMAYEGVDVWLHAFLTSALDGDEWSASRFDRFNEAKENSSPI